MPYPPHIEIPIKPHAIGMKWRMEPLDVWNRTMQQDQDCGSPSNVYMYTVYFISNDNFQEETATANCCFFLKVGNVVHPMINVGLT